MTLEYEQALNAVREATAKYSAVCKSYRAGQIGDKEFLAADRRICLCAKPKSDCFASWTGPGR